jgi:hypothetical protein
LNFEIEWYLQSGDRLSLNESAIKSSCSTRDTSLPLGDDGWLDLGPGLDLLWQGRNRMGWSGMIHKWCDNGHPGYYSVRSAIGGEFGVHQLEVDNGDHWISKRHHELRMSEYRDLGRSDPSSTFTAMSPERVGRIHTRGRSRPFSSFWTWAAASDLV